MNDQIKPDNFTSKDVEREGKKVGADVLRTAAVWTLAGLLTQTAREVIIRTVKQFQKR